MMKSVRVGVAALAFTGLVAQPMVANAGGDYYCHPPIVDNSAGIFWALGFFLCAGMSVGQQDVWAKKHHTTVSGKQRASGLLDCVFPVYGFYKHAHQPA